MKKPYEKPVIFKLKTGFMNKFGTQRGYRKVRKSIDGIAIEDLVAEFGSPLFVFSEKKLRDSFRRIKQAFSSRYPNIEFSWSYKTNYLDAICLILHSEGEGAEVVSDFEYEKAKRLGVSPNRIIFNGPYKPVSVLEEALLDGARVNIDSFEEITDAEAIAVKHGRKFNVGIRVNLDAGIHPRWDRFGFNLENGQAFDAAKRILVGGKLNITGLHCHIGTFILDTSAYEKQVLKLLEFKNRLEKELGFSIEYIDIGGGFPSRSRLKGSFLPTEVSVPDIEEFAEVICSCMLSHVSGASYPKLIIEAGRAVVDEAGYLITTVVATKRLPDGRKGYVLDAGVNLLFTSFWYHFNVELDRSVFGSMEPSVLYGPLCMNIDVIDDALFLPPLTRGTRLILSPVGAYNVTQWMQFITYRPNIVLISADGKPYLIREREYLEDVVSKEKIPEYLLNSV